MSELPQKTLREIGDVLCKDFCDELLNIEECYGRPHSIEVLQLLRDAYIKGRLEGEAFMLLQMTPKVGKV